MAFEPVHPPEAVQDVAFVLDHESCDVPFTVTLAGVALKLTVGAGVGGGGLGAALVTVTLVEPCAVPPAPVQLSEKVPEAVIAAVTWVPEVAFDPLHTPEAVQELASVLLHVSVEVWPLEMAVGCAVTVTVGAVEEGVPPSGAVALLLLSPPPPHAVTPTIITQQNAAFLNLDTSTARPLALGDAGL